MYKIMTPGPTQVRENVRLTRAMAATNPDLDPAFLDFYQTTCQKFARFLGASGQVYILGGEGILGLEAACASLTEPGDRVLVIDNGIFGKGFADFVRLYDGDAVLYTCDDQRGVDVEQLADFLSRDHDFKYATVVHCDTPSGVLNDIGRICPLLHQYGILTVVDSVAAMFGEVVKVDDWQIDILCGGSQKALSAAPGLTIVAVSQAAEAAMRARQTPIKAFYANLMIWQGYAEAKWFPYTPPISDIYSLGTALDNVLAEPGIFDRHQRLAHAVRQAVTTCGLRLYTVSDYADTVTVIRVPQGLKASDITQPMAEQYGVLIAGCFDTLAEKVIRIGHMGENANAPDLAMTLNALERVLRQLGVPLKGSMQEVFWQALAEEGQN